MRLHTAKKKVGDYWDTYCEVAGVELDNVRVYFDSSPAEPDVGFYGDLEIESVEHGGKDVMCDMSQSEHSVLLDRLDEYLTAYAEDDGYGDWLYDQRKDDRLTGDL